eukprot:285238_1
MSSLQTESFVWRIPSLTSSQQSLLCHGYIRLQNYFKMPSEIKQLCTKYFCPNDETTIHDIKHATNGTSFRSRPFTMFSEQWYLHLYPNGYRSTEINEVKLWLCSKILSPDLESINMRMKLIFIEDDVKYEGTHAFSALKELGWLTGTLQTSVIQQYDTLSFKIEAELLNRNMTISYVVQIIEDKFNSISSQINALSSKMNSNTDKIDDLVKDVQFIKNNISNNIKNENDTTSEHDKLRQWLTNTVKLPQYYQMFIDNGVNQLSVLELLDMKSLTEIGVSKIGHRLKILHLIKQLVMQ